MCSDMGVLHSYWHMGVTFKSLKVLWHEMFLKIESDIKAPQNYTDNIAILPIVGSISLAT